MRITLIYPPDIILPTAPYASLAVLPPCLEQAGHEVICRDLNLEVFNALMKRETLLGYYNGLEDRMTVLEKKSALTEYEAEELWMIERLLTTPTSIFDDLEFAMSIMNDPDMLSKPETFVRAIDALMGAETFVFTACPTPFTAPMSTDRVLASFDANSPDPVIDALSGGIVESIVQEKPDLVAITMPFNHAIFQALKLMKLLKDLEPEIPIIVGGAVVGGQSFDFLEDKRLYDFYDYIMLGEGDIAFPEAATALERGDDPKTISGISYVTPEKTVQRNDMQMVDDLNQLPTPDYTKVPMGDYLFPNRVAILQTSRGCYYRKCKFCSDSWRGNFRMRKPELVLDDIIKISETAGIDYFQFFDTLTPPRTLIHVAKGIKERGLKICWSAETKFEKVYTRPGVLQTMAEGGGRLLQFGFESGVDRILDLMRKGTNMKTVDAILNEMCANGMYAGITWFIGYPQETGEEADCSFDYIARHRDSISLSGFIGNFTLGPGTIIYAHPEDLGIKVIQKEDGTYDYCYEDGTPHFDAAERCCAFNSRSDLKLLRSSFSTLIGMGESEEARWKITGQYRFGPFIRHIDPSKLETLSLQMNDECRISRFARHPFKSAEENNGAVFAYQMMTGDVYEVPDFADAIFKALEKPLPLPELREKVSMEESKFMEIVDMAVNRGLIRIICDPEDIHYLS